MCSVFVDYLNEVRIGSFAAVLAEMHLLAP